MLTHPVTMVTASSDQHDGPQRGRRRRPAAAGRAGRPARRRAGRRAATAAAAAARASGDQERRRAVSEATSSGPAASAMPSPRLRDPATRQQPPEAATPADGGRRRSRPGAAHKGEPGYVAKRAAGAASGAARSASARAHLRMRRCGSPTVEERRCLGGGEPVVLLLEAEDEGLELAPTRARSRRVLGSSRRGSAGRCSCSRSAPWPCMSLPEDRGVRGVVRYRPGRLQESHRRSHRSTCGCAAGRLSAVGSAAPAGRAGRSTTSGS